MTVSTKKQTPSLAKDVCQLVNKHFADLLENIPGLKGAEQYNTLMHAREALKAELIGGEV